MLILTAFADTTEVAELMFSRITGHLPIALAGIIIPHEEIITPIQDKEDILVPTVLTVLTDHITGGSSIQRYSF